MADYVELEQDAINFATRAIKCDQSGLVDTAVFYYQVSRVWKQNLQRHIQRKTFASGLTSFL